MADQDLRVLNDRYEIHRRLARGGMAQVYLARDRSLDRPVAVKELVPEFAADPSFVERFRREAQAAANLSHPNVVGVYDWGAQDGTYFIVMEYVDGPSLSRVLRTDGPFHPRRAAEIATEVAAGLGFAHSRGVVHRDVKPGNVLLTRSGQAKVTDFGIARALSSPDEDLTQAGSVMGTATYFSPEQAQGLAVDPRSDLYSLGVVLYELVTGRPPFTGDTPLAIAYKHVQDEPARPSTMISGLPVSLEAIIMKLMSKRPDDRYSTAEDLRADLNRFLAGEPTVAERDLVAAGAGAAAVVVSDEPATTVQAATVAGEAVPPVAPPDEPTADEPKKRTWVFAVALVVGLALLGGALFWFTRSLEEGNEVTVPALIGLELDAATAALDEAGLEADVSRRPSDQFEPGIVMDQDPGKDEKVDSGSTVKLVVSSGPEIVEVPNVVLLTQTEATARLDEAGLTVKVTPREVAGAEPGYVVEQNPAPGTEVSPGDQVEIFVSVDAGTVLVPDVVGRPLAQAQTQIQAAGLRFAAATEQSSDSVAAGSVISTDPAGGSSVERNSTVNIVVSSGREQVAVPDVVGQTETNATSALRAQGFAVRVSPKSVPAGDPGVGRVITQSPDAGSDEDKGSTVTIEVGVASSTTTTSSPTSSTSTTAP
ncbi:MAG: Stk1 family PASTA domain-containing Ser/Thr kinase [Microthrixaceae bacterium]